MYFLLSVEVLPFVVSEKALAEGEAQIHMGRMLAVLQVILSIIYQLFWFWT